MATKFRTKRSYSKGRNKTWSKRAVNTGPDTNGMKELYGSGKNLNATHKVRRYRDIALSWNEPLPKAEPQAKHQREGKPFLVKDKKGEYIVDEQRHSLFDPVDPRLRVEMNIQVIRSQGGKVEEFLWIYIFNAPTLKVKHYWYGNEHFLERINIFKGTVQRSRMYQGRAEMLQSFHMGLIFWHEVKEEQRNTPPP